MNNLPVTKWWQVFNPAIYLISILPAFTVLLLAGERSVAINELVFSTIAVILLQHAINLFNDVSDWRLGADIEKMDSWVRVHDGNTRPVTLHALISFLLGGVLGLLMLIVADKLWIAFFTLPLIGLGYLYNAGEKPLSYNWMGEWVTGICYGPGIFGGLWFVSGLTLNVATLCGMLACAALAVSLLLSHQPPQIETDRKVGKKSFAVRFGRNITCQISVLLFTLAMLLIGTGMMINRYEPYFITIYLLISLSVSFYLLKSLPTPRKILFSSSVILLLSCIYIA